jgi:hypothetical protein
MHHQGLCAVLWEAFPVCGIRTGVVSRSKKEAEQALKDQQMSPVNQ